MNVSCPALPVSVVLGLNLNHILELEIANVYKEEEEEVGNLFEVHS